MQFVAAGLAVLAFDYRGFGGSTGLPRHWVSPRRHLQDWEAVVSHVQVGPHAHFICQPSPLLAAASSSPLLNLSAPACCPALYGRHDVCGCMRDILLCVLICVSTCVQATSLGGRVDAGRLALWGVSYAGGHVIVTAARFGDSIKAVIANVSQQRAWFSP